MSEKFDEYAGSGLVPIQAMLPDGSFTTVLWEDDYIPLSTIDSFVLREIPGRPGVFDFVITPKQESVK
jgi:hypothetical protein